MYVPSNDEVHRIIILKYDPPSFISLLPTNELDNAWPRSQALGGVARRACSRMYEHPRWNSTGSGYHNIYYISCTSLYIHSWHHGLSFLDLRRIRSGSYMHFGVCPVPIYALGSRTRGQRVCNTNRHTSDNYSSIVYIIPSKNNDKQMRPSAARSV